MVWYWSDAYNALSWIKAPKRDLNNYCARRAAQIRESTDPTHWNHVPTEQNPADLITRGKDPKELAGEGLWLNGPRFLTTGDWPKQKINAVPNFHLPDEAELRRLVGIFHARASTESLPELIPM